MDPPAHPRIVIPPGVLHASEALGVYLAHGALPNPNAAMVERTRDPEKFAGATFLIGVGAHHDPEAGRFDHHQKGANATFKDRAAVLSSGGQVYAHYGRTVIGKLLAIDPASPAVDALYDYMYDAFVHLIDLGTNGVIRDKTGIYSRVQRLYGNDRAIMRLIESEFLALLRWAHTQWLPANEQVRMAVGNRYNIHESGRVVVFETYVPWTDHIHSVDANSNVLYVVYPRKAGGFLAQAVPSAHSFCDPVLSFPDEWAGKSRDELRAITGIDGCEFVHRNRHIAGNQTLAGAIAMAVKASDI